MLMEATTEFQGQLYNVKAYDILSTPTGNKMIITHFSIEDGFPINQFVIVNNSDEDNVAGQSVLYMLHGNACTGLMAILI